MMRQTLTFPCLCCLALGCLALPSTSWGEVFVAQNLGTLGGYSSNAYAVNSLNQVVGESWTSENERHAFLWTAQTGMIDLGPGIAYDINDSGLIVGVYDYQAVVWENGEMTFLPMLEGWPHAALGVNSKGAVVGYTDNQAVQWEKVDGEWQITENFEPVFDNYPGSRAYAINEDGEVTGSAYTGDFSFDLGDIWRAFRISGENTLDIGSLSYGSNGYAINAAGQIVGTSTMLFCDFDQRAFYWSGSGFMQDISPFPNDCTWACARDINDSGLVVGDGYGETFEQEYWDSAFVYDELNGTRLVNDLVLPFSGLDIHLGNGLNNAGRIAGQQRVNDRPRASLISSTEADCNANGTVDVVELVGTVYAVAMDTAGLYEVTAPSGATLELVDYFSDAGITHALSITRHPTTGELYMIAVIGSDNYLTKVDPATADVEVLGALGNWIDGDIVSIAFGIDGTLYGLQDHFLFDAAILIIDPDNPDAPALLTTGSPGLWKALAVDPRDGMIYQTGGSNLMRIDPQNPTPVLVSDHINLDIGGMGFNPVTGELLALLESGNIYSIDIVAGTYRQFNNAYYGLTPSGMVFAPTSLDANGDLVPDECTPGDADGDGLIGLADYAEFGDCLTGPEGGVFVGCGIFNTNVDNDVDLDDAANLLNDWSM
jgi:probable HAF family extracellular repeat protein